MHRSEAYCFLDMLYLNKGSEHIKQYAFLLVQYGDVMDEDNIAQRSQRLDLEIALLCERGIFLVRARYCKEDVSV